MLMFNFIKNYKKDVTKNSLMMFMLLIFLTSIVLVVGATYAEPTHKITFMETVGAYYIKECPTDINGKLEQECIDYISEWCGEWSLNMRPNQSVSVKVDDFQNITFNKDETYYCKSGSSNPNREGRSYCYVCNDSSGIMKWDNNGDKDSQCDAGYKRDESISFENCKNFACYECSTDNKIMEWKYESIGDEKCPSGYNKTTKTKDECKYVEPEPEYACYECSTDNKIMEWRHTADGDGNCPNGYNKTTKTKDECKYIEPEPESACYVCKNNNNVMKWDNDGSIDNDCSSGYTKTNTPKTECAPIKNPPTNDILIFGVWIIGLGAICYSVYYFRKMSLNN